MQRVSKRSIVNLSRTVRAVHFEYDEPIYRATIEVFVGGTADALCAYLRRQDVTFSPTVFEGFDSIGKYFKLYRPKDGSVQSRVIWIQDWKGLRENFLTLHHEIVHLTFSVMRDRGVELCSQSEEAFTYYIEAVFTTIVQDVEKVYGQLKRAKKKGRRKR